MRREPWQIRLTSYHRATKAQLYRPRKRFGRIRYVRHTMFTKTSGPNHERRAIEAVLELIPATQEYVVVPMEDGEQ